MAEFLTLLAPGEALRRWLALVNELVEPENVTLAEALGRVTAVPVVATSPLPSFPRSTVDGYALRAVDSFGASESLPAYLALSGEVLMGCAPGEALQPRQCMLIHTGGMLPENSDAVIMVEFTQLARPGEVELLRPVAAGENVLYPGEEVKAGETVIPGGVILRPAELGGLAALGSSTIAVARQPHLGVLSSGDELVTPEQQPMPGQVRDVNTYSLSALIQNAGGVVQSYGIISDREAMLYAAARQALLENDGLVITAGSSASSRDLTARVIQRLGEPGVVVHGINVRPGKPTILAICDRKPVIGLPGNPASALVIAELFIIPLLKKMLGFRPEQLCPVVRARLTINLPSQTGREDWIAVKLLPVNDGYQAEPVFGKSNFIFTLVRADGLIHIPAEASGLSAGQMVDVQMRK